MSDDWPISSPNTDCITDRLVQMSPPHGVSASLMARVASAEHVMCDIVLLDLISFEGVAGIVIVDSTASFNAPRSGEEDLDVLNEVNSESGSLQLVQDTWSLSKRSITISPKSSSKSGDSCTTDCSLDVATLSSLDKAC